MNAIKRLGLLLATAMLVATSAYADIILREDTAAQIEPIGPFADTSGDPVTDLTIANTDVMLSKGGAAFAAKNSGGCTHDSSAPGMYLCTFDATDSSTVGGLTIYVKMTGALPVYHTARVVEEAVYDACCAAGAAPATPTSIWAAASRTLTAFDEDNMTIDINSTAVGAAASVTGAVGSVTGNVGGTVNGLTSTAQGHVQTASAAALTAYDPPTRAELTSDIAGLDSLIDTLDLVADAIKAKTDNLTFTVTGQVDANVESMNATEVLGTGTEADPWNGE